jgi:phosphate:Na+ symporter
VVQSSSAVTVATLGFVNARLLSLERAITVTYGSNLGTTMTGWLVVLTGFKFDIQALALPLVGVGMALQLTGAAHRRGQFGLALTGFGLFFLGIDALQTGLAGAPEIRLGEHGPVIVRTLAYVGMGVLLTVISQSSSAAIAILISAVMTESLALELAAAAVIGANLGTTSTALLGTIGATANARRVALGHVAFNAVTAAVALMLLPVLLALVQWLRSWLELGEGAGALLALFHTLFNLIGVLVMLPLTPRLVRLLRRCYQTREETLQAPKYLDHTVLATPSLAADALLSELEDIERLARQVADAALTESSAEREPELQALRLRLDAVLDFTDQLARGGVPDSLQPALALVPWVTRSLRDAAQLAEALAAPDLGGGAAPAAIAAFLAQAQTVVAAPEPREATLTQLRQSYEQARLAALRLQEAGTGSARRILAWLDHIHRVHHLARAVVKIALRLAQARQALANPEAPAQAPALAGDDPEPRSD